MAFFLMAGVGGLLTAGLVMPAVAATSGVTSTSSDLFEQLPTDLEQVPLSEKSTVLAADGTLLATFYVENRIVVTLDQVSQHMRNAVISTEDRRFYEHGGVDLTGMGRALVNNVVKEGGQEGGSTLTQQYVKNALIQAALTSEDPQERNAQIAAARASKGAEGYARKLHEAKVAVALEERMTKDQILEAYLNIAQFGLSVYGVEAASQHYFSISAKDLNYLQAATIAGITKGPTEYDPERNPVASEGRRNIVLQNMLREKNITQEEYDAGIATPLPATLVIGQTRLGCMTANAVYNAGYFCDYVTKVIAQNPAFGETQRERAQLLYRGGLTIRTTLDPRLQDIADREVKAGIPVADPSGVASAISVIEPGTGKIVAMAQNRIYNSAQNTAPGETAVNYNTDFAYGSSGGFAPGSTFKPFTLAQWLKEGHSLNEVIDARKRERDFKEFSAPCTAFAPEKWDPANADPGRDGPMTVLDATKNSVNSGYVEMATKLDLCGVMETAKSMGVHQANGKDFNVLPSNVLGSDSVAPLTMAAAFATFAANGTYCEPIAITSVQDSNGQELAVPQANCRAVLSPEISSAMNFALSHVWEGTGKRIGALPDRPSAGKTGTTSRNESTWFAGYTPQLASVVWVGFAEGFIPVQNITINGTYIEYTYGSTIAGPTWKRFMTQALAGAPVVEFPAPNRALVEGVQISVPSVAGRSAGDAKAILEKAGFTVRTSGTKEPSAIAAGLVARTDPGPGASLTKGSVVTLVISDGPGALPPPAAPPEAPPAAPPAVPPAGAAPGPPDDKNPNR